MKDRLRAVICKSAAGYYIGVLDSNGFPYTRCTGYFGKREDAECHYNENGSFECIYTGAVYYKPIN